MRSVSRAALPRDSAAGYDGHDAEEKALARRTVLGHGPTTVVVAKFFHHTRNDTFQQWSSPEV